MENRRSSPRVATNVAVGMRAPATPMCVIVRDLSLHGCQIESARPLDIDGNTVRLDLTDAVSVSGKVMWVDGLYAGIQFDKRLDVTKFGVRGWITHIGDAIEMRQIDRAA